MTPNVSWNQAQASRSGLLAQQPRQLGDVGGDAPGLVRTSKRIQVEQNALTIFSLWFT
jgi:hypothetical protein